MGAVTDDRIELVITYGGAQTYKVQSMSRSRLRTSLVCQNCQPLPCTSLYHIVECSIVAADRQGLHLFYPRGVQKADWDHKAYHDAPNAI